MAESLSPLTPLNVKATDDDIICPFLKISENHQLSLKTRPYHGSVHKLGPKFERIQILRGAHGLVVLSAHRVQRRCTSRTQVQLDRPACVKTRITLHDSARSGTRIVVFGLTWMHAGHEGVPVSVTRSYISLELYRRASEYVGSDYTAAAGCFSATNPQMVVDGGDHDGKNSEEARVMI